MRTLVSYAFLWLLLAVVPAHGQSISVDAFGAIGNGTADDTVAMQRAFTYCSREGVTCQLSTGKSYQLTAPVYLWGKANVLSWSTSTTTLGTLVFAAGAAPYLVNIGISGTNAPEEPWSGTIKNIGLRVASGSATGRILYFWRVDGGVVTGTVGEVGAFSYSLTSSGNNNAYLPGSDTIRKNLTLSRNTFTAAGRVDGSEGIGLGSWDGALIEGNVIRGVGDDPIGIHYSRNIVIRDNTLSSTDGRLYVSNSVNVKIHHNSHRRVARADTGTFVPGISLLYIGHESTLANSYPAPEDTDVHGNTLIYPEGAVDAGSAITVYGGRTVTALNNTVINNSSLVAAHGLYTAPWYYSDGAWTDPTGLDTQTARMRDITLAGNQLVGAYPLNIVQTGPSAYYLGTYTVSGNTAKGIAASSTNRHIGNNFTGKPIAPTYAQNITFDASQGSGGTLITATDGNPFTIQNPVNAVGGNYYPAGSILTVTILNASSVALGAISWGNQFRLAGVFTPPASGSNRTITFINSSVYGWTDQWREISRGVADVPN